MRSPGQYQVEDFVTDESFIQYFFQLDPKDIAFWEKWVRENPDRQGSVDAAKDMLRSLTLTLPEAEMAGETARIKAALEFDTAPDPKKRPVLGRLLPFGPVKRHLNKKRRLHTGAILSMLLLLSTGIYLLERTLILSGRSIEKVNKSNAPVVFSLIDGTAVTLAPQSVLRFAPGFGDRDRTVYLNGEAQFDVTRKTDHPFEVHESDIVVTALGTKFSIRKQSGDSIIMIELIKGRLKVETTAGSPASGSIVLNPDERVVYDRHRQQFFKESWQPKAELPFQAGHVLFRRNNFDEIAAKMKAAFGVTMLNKSKRRNWMFSGEFENATVQEIVGNICVVERLNFEITGDTILVK